MARWTDCAPLGWRRRYVRASVLWTGCTNDLPAMPVGSGASICRATLALRRRWCGRRRRWAGGGEVFALLWTGRINDLPAILTGSGAELEVADTSNIPEILSLQRCSAAMLTEALLLNAERSSGGVSRCLDDTMKALFGQRKRWTLTQRPYTYSPPSISVHLWLLREVSAVVSFLHPPSIGNRGRTWGPSLPFWRWLCPCPIWGRATHTTGSASTDDNIGWTL